MKTENWKPTSIVKMNTRVRPTINIKFKPMWFLIAFACSLLVPGSSIFFSIWHAIFGRLYIAYWMIKYSEIWLGWIEYARNL